MVHRVLYQSSLINTQEHICLPRPVGPLVCGWRLILCCRLTDWWMSHTGLPADELVQPDRPPRTHPWRHQGIVCRSLPSLIMSRCSLPSYSPTSCDRFLAASWPDALPHVCSTGPAWPVVPLPRRQPGLHRCTPALPLHVPGQRAQQPEVQGQCRSLLPCTTTPYEQRASLTPPYHTCTPHALSFLPLCGTQHLVHLLTCLRLGRDDENWDTHLQHTHGKPRVTPVVHAFHDVQLASVVRPGECCTCIL